MAAPIGEANVSPLSVRLGMRPSAQQWRVIRYLEGLGGDDTFAFEIDARAMGRTAAKTEDAHRSLEALSRAVSSFEGFGHPVPYFARNRVFLELGLNLANSPSCMRNSGVQPDRRSSVKRWGLCPLQPSLPLKPFRQVV